MDDSQKPNPVNHDLLKRMGKAFNSHDIDTLMEFFAEDGVFVLARGTEPWGRRLKGRAEIRQLLTERFKNVTDMKWEEVDVWFCGNRAVTEFIVTGTSKSGQKVNYHGCDLFLFNDQGKIVIKDTYWKSNEPVL